MLGGIDLRQPKVCVSMLGGLTVKVDDTILIDTNGKPGKLWETFVILAMTRNKPIDNDVLTDYLWVGDESSNPSNALKNAIYCLRRDIFGALCEDSNIILFSLGRYSLNPKVNFHIDIEDFESLYNSAINTDDTEQQIVLFKKLIDMYKNGFVPALATASYASSWVSRFKAIYVDVSSRLGVLLLARGQAAKVIALCKASFKIEALDQRLYLNLLNALLFRKQYNTIISAYHQISTHFSLELQVDLCSDIKKIFNKACGNIYINDDDVIAIRNELEDCLNDATASKKARYCTYDVLKYICITKAKEANRSDKQTAVMLLTIANQDDSRIDGNVIIAAMEALKLVLLTSLRKGDAFAKYTKTQYAVLLASDSVEKLDRAVFARILMNFNNCADTLKVKIVANIEALRQ